MRLKHWIKDSGEPNHIMRHVSGPWYAVPLAEYSDYSVSFIYQANYEAIEGIIARNVSRGLVRYRYGRAGSHWLELHHAIRCPELVDALESLADYPCLDDERSSQLEWDYAFDSFDEQAITHDMVDRCAVVEYPDKDMLFSFLGWHEASPCNVRYAQLFLEDLLNAGLKLEPSYIRDSLEEWGNDIAIKVIESHNHLTDEEMGVLPHSELGRLLVERAARANEKQGKLF